MNDYNETTFLEKYLTLEGLLHRYFAWKRREQGPHANPHRGQGRILSILKLQPEITQKEMTYLLDMRPQSLGELLNKLEKSGFITREPSEADRRVVIVKLTEAGAEEAEKLSQVEEETIFDTLTDEEKAQFEAIIEKLTATLEAEMPEELRYSGRPDGRGRGFGPHGMGGKHGGRGGYPGFDPNDFDGHKRHHHHHHHSFNDFYGGCPENNPRFSEE